MKVLLLEDDRLLGESLQEYLELDGTDVIWAKDGQEVLDLTFDEQYDLYVFDINVPEINGLELLKELRQAGDKTPAIYVSALCDVESIAKGFQTGAVDYIKKPFDPEELILRIRHHLQSNTHNSKMYTYSNITLDPHTQTVQKGGELIAISGVLKEILMLLMSNQDRVVSPDEIFEYMNEPSHNALRVTISRLKKKLDIEIINIRGEGYRLA